MTTDYSLSERIKEVRFFKGNGITKLFLNKGSGKPIELPIPSGGSDLSSQSDSLTLYSNAVDPQQSGWAPLQGDVGFQSGTSITLGSGSTVSLNAPGTYLTVATVTGSIGPSGTRLQVVLSDATTNGIGGVSDSDETTDTTQAAVTLSLLSIVNNNPSQDAGSSIVTLNFTGTYISGVRVQAKLLVAKLA